MRLPKLLAGVALASVVLAACGTGGGGGTSNKGTIKIGVELPESGAEASNGIPTLNGVKYAVQTAGTVEGFKLEVYNLDDAVNGVHDPQKGAQNLQTFVADSKVLGVVGPFNSSVARAEIPISNRASLAQISPANTNQCLTKNIYIPTSLGAPKDITCKDAGLPSPSDLRPTGVNNYFRVATTDDLQGPAMADYAVDTLKVTKVGVASDNEVYGKGIADTFSAEFKKKGGTIVKRQDFDTKSTNDFRGFLSSAQRLGATAIYFGGTDSNKGCVIRAQMKNVAGFTADSPYMGGDGLQTAQCLKDAGDNASGIYAAVAAPNAEQIPESKSIIDGFKKAFPNKDDFGAYSMPAYDSAKILIAAIQRAIKANNGNMPSREQVRAEVAKTTDFTGALGKTTFDQNGDTSQKIVSIYQAKGSPVDWAWVKQINFGQTS
jgi:branched-chain amino acid transport system substrate-binding protein